MIWLRRNAFPDIGKEAKLSSRIESAEVGSQSAGTEGTKDLSLSVVKASQILRVIGESDHGCTLTEIAQATRLGTTVCHRMLGTLVHERLVDKNPDDGRFRLGLGILAMAHKVQSHHPLVRAAAHLMSETVAYTEDIALLMVRDGDGVLCIDRKEGAFPVRSSGTQVGTRLPMHCGGAPLALLAFSADDYIERYLASQSLEKRTARTVTDPALVRREVERVRKRGYAIGNQDLFDYVVALGFPLFAPGGMLIGALSVGGVEQRYTPKRIKQIGEWLAAASQKAFPRH
jgi:DNA-binding IclR family transcriptional regulator